MEMKEELRGMVEKLKQERDELKLKLHLGSMEAKDEFEEAEKKLAAMKAKMLNVADDAIETSDEYIAKTKIIGEELKETYRRISQRLSK